MLDVLEILYTWVYVVKERFTFNGSVATLGQVCER